MPWAGGRICATGPCTPCALCQRRVPGDLERLQWTVQEVGRQLHNIQPAHVEGNAPRADPPDGPGASRWHPLFRPAPVNGSFAGWVFDRWKLAPGDMRRPLLEKQGFLSNWRHAEAGDVLDRLLAYCRQVFAPVREMTLADVLRRKDEAEAEMLSLSLVREAIPLLRADLDQLGGGSHVHNARFLLRDLTLRGRRAYQALEPDEQRNVQLFDDWLRQPDAN
jgi:hypothetical protein